MYILINDEALNKIGAISAEMCRESWWMYYENSIL